MINSSIKLDICVWYFYIFASNVCISVAETDTIMHELLLTYSTDHNESRGKKKVATATTTTIEPNDKTDCVCNPFQNELYIYTENEFGEWFLVKSR